MLIGGLAVQLRAEFLFDEFRLGLTAATFFAASAIASIPGSRLVERVGWRRGAALTSLVSIVGLVTVAALVRSWPMLLAAMVLLGLGNSLGQPSANLLLARSVMVGRRALAFGIKQSAVPLASTIAGVAVPLIAITFGWRATFLTMALVGTAMLLLLLGSKNVAPDRPMAPRQGRTTRDAPKPALLRLAAASGFGTSAINVVISFLVTYAVVVGLTPGQAGWLLGGVSGSAAVIRIALGWFGDRHTSGHLRFIIAMMIAGASGFLLLAFASAPELVVLGAVLCGALGWSWNGLFILRVIEEFRSAPAAASGYVLGANYAGGVVGPLMFGMIVSRFGYRPGWLFASLLMLFAAWFAQLGRTALRHGREAEEREAAEREAEDE
jgi:MFS family permease